MINFAVIGTSNITYEFISAALKSNRFSLSAVYSRTKQKGEEFARKFGCHTVYTSLTDLVKDDSVTAVYVASPNALHYEQSKFLLEHGKNVICEKTITSNATEFLELSKIAKKNNLIYMDAIMSRHSINRKKLINAIGEIGNINLARIDFSKLSARYFTYIKGIDENIFSMKLGAGALTDIGIYCVYAAVDLFGMPKNISAKANFLRDGADGCGIAVFDYGDFDAVLTYGKVSQSGIGSEILGDDGTIVLASVSQYDDIKLIKNGTTEILAKPMSKIEIMVGEAVSFANYIEHFSDYSDEYISVTTLTHNVLLCLEDIKNKAKIIYN